MVWAKRLAKILTGLAIMFVIVDVICIVSVYIDCSSIVSSRLNDLVRITAQENCLETSTSKASFEKLLQSTVEQNQWIQFTETEGVVQGLDNRNTNVDMDYAVFVGSVDNSTSYYSYESAPQRGGEIKCTIKATAAAPFFLFGFSGYVNIPIEQSYTTLGLKYYKGK